MKVLLQELQLVSNVAPLGSHKKAAKKLKISSSYLKQIRSGDNLTRDTADNRKLMRKIIAVYRKINNKAGVQLLDIHSPLIQSHTDLLQVAELFLERMFPSERENSVVGIEVAKIIDNAKHLKLVNQNI